MRARGGTLGRCKDAPMEALTFGCERIAINAGVPLAGSRHRRLRLAFLVAGPR
jgi:hypothetical protein